MGIKNIKYLNEVLIDWGNSLSGTNEIISTDSINNRFKDVYEWDSPEYIKNVKWAIDTFNFLFKGLQSENFADSVEWPFGSADVDVLEIDINTPNIEINSSELGSLLNVYRGLSNNTICNLNTKVKKGNIDYFSADPFLNWVTRTENYVLSYSTSNEYIPWCYIAGFDIRGGNVRAMIRKNGIQDTVKKYLEYAENEIFGEDLSIIEDIIDTKNEWESGGRNIQHGNFKTLGQITLNNINTPISVKALKVWEDDYSMYLVSIPTNKDAFYIEDPGKLNLFTNISKYMWEYHPWYWIFPFVPWT